MNSNPTGYPTTMQQHANPMLAAATGYPVQSGSPSNQQFPFYANPMAGYPQVQPQPQARPGTMQQQQHSFNPMQIQTSGGAMMPGMAAQHTNLPYSSPSPYHPTSLPTTTAAASPPHTQSPTTAAPGAMQMPSQNMAAVSNPAMMAAQQQQLPQQQPQQRPAQPTNQPAQGQQPGQQQPQQVAPQSPAAAARERARVSTLLEINATLLQELLNLQAAGKSGGPPQPPANPEQQSSSPNSSTESAATSEAPRKPSQEYVECLKRLQTNLIYLASVTDRNKKPVSPAPAILSPPPHMTNLVEIYAKLSELFSGVPRAGPAHQQRPSQSGLATETTV